jgi:hypothetical protein
VPRSSRILRRAGTTNVCATGFDLKRTKLRPQHRYPPLQKTQGRGTLSIDGAHEHHPKAGDPPRKVILRKLSAIRFVTPRQSQNLWGDKGVFVTLEVAKLERAWRYNRVPEHGGRDPDTKFQYDRAKKWIGFGQKVELWATTVTREDDEDDALCFVEGRHSFAVLRDLGYVTIEAWVHKDEADELTRRYGAK